MHRILATNDYLYKIKKKDNWICSFCKREKETITHLFYECEAIKSLWIKLSQYIFDKTSIRILFTKEEIILGKQDNKQIAENNLILFTKSLIYKQKFKNSNIQLNNLIREISYRYKVEKLRQKLNGKSQVFLKVWGKFAQCFDLTF